MPMYFSLQNFTYTARGELITWNTDQIKLICIVLNNDKIDEIVTRFKMILMFLMQPSVC